MSEVAEELIRLQNHYLNATCKYWVHLTTTRYNILDDDNSEFRTLKLVFVMRNEVANRVGIARNMFLFTVNVKLKRR